METVEVIVYILVALIVGGLFLAFMKGLSFDESQKTIENEAAGKRDIKFTNLNKDELLATILTFWNEHKFKEISTSTTIFAADSGILNKAVLFDYVREQHQCETLQSEEMSCGFREDVVMGSITTPAVIRLTYENDTLFISPESEQYEKTYHNYEFVAFGGFEGQGKITKITKKIPEEAIILRMKMKVNSGRDFRMYINNKPCSGLFEATGFVDTWDISDCFTLVKKGQENNFTIVFPGAGSLMKYYGGGYIQIDYLTLQPEETVVKKYDFPGINGSINLFSSFYIPGQLTAMDLELHYNVDNSTTQDLELLFGDTIIHTDAEKDVDKRVSVSNDVLRSILDYAELSSSTVPLRLTASKEEKHVVNTTPENGSVDVILITDLSSSMRDKMGGTGSGVCGGPNTKKIDVAVCVDKIFVDVVLNKTGNRVGLVGYYRRVSYPEDPELMVDLTEDKQYLLSVIDNYPRDRDGTCIACGILAATWLLEGAINPPVMVVMSDGEANKCVVNNDPNQFKGCGHDGKNQAIQLADKAREAGIEVYAISFGKDADPAAMRQIADDDAHFAEGDDVAALEEIYRNLAKIISRRPRRSGSKGRVQTIPVYKPNQTVESILYPDSYISLDYNPFIPGPGLTSISFRVEQRLTDCMNNVFLPSSFRTTEGFLLSYSGMFWTKRVTVNGVTVYDVQQYGNMSLTDIGDPFEIYLPDLVLHSGQNTVEVVFASSQERDIACGSTIYEDNSIIYTAYLLESATAGMQFNSSHGCRWHIEFEDGGIREFRIPLSYMDAEECWYTSAEQSYNENDLYAYATYRLLMEIDSDGDYGLDAEVEDILLYDS